MKFVIDANVAVKWAIDEPLSDRADALLADGIVLHAPSHWLGEAATALWAKSAVHGLLSQEECEARIEALAAVPIAEMPVRSLIVSAAAIAFLIRATVYDALYVALAERTGALLVTADLKLHRKVAAEPRYVHLVRWLGDVTAEGTGPTAPSGSVPPAASPSG